MHIGQVSTISFKGKIIDAHAHIGNWNNASYNTDSLDTFVRQPLDNGDSIEKILVSNLSCIDQSNIQDEIKPTIVDLIKKLEKIEKDGKTFDYTDRLLFGSDAPIGEFATGKDGLSGKEFYNKTVLETKNAIKNNFGERAEELIDKIFYRNAESLFFGQKPQIVNSTEQAVKKVSKTKIGMIAATAILSICAIVGFTSSKKLTKQKNTQTIHQTNINEIVKKYGINNH